MGEVDYSETKRRTGSVHAVAHHELIRRKHFVNEMSQRAIAGELGHSRKFVKKALEHPTPRSER